MKFDTRFCDSLLLYAGLIVGLETSPASVTPNEFGIWVRSFNKEGDLEITDSHHGHVLTIHQNDFPVWITCNGKSPVVWKWEYSNPPSNDVIETINSAFEMNRTFVYDINGSGNYTTGLKLLNYSQTVVRRFRCVSTTRGSSYLILNIQFKLENCPILIDPGKKFIVTPVVGDLRIVLPCRVHTISSDVFVEKVTSWTTRKVDLYFDHSVNGFTIRSTGSYTDLIANVGNYRCVELGSQASVEVEVTSPVDYLVNPNQDAITVSSGSPIKTRCMSQVPIKFSVHSVDSKLKEYTVVYYTNPSNQFPYTAELTYIPLGEDTGEVLCKLDRGNEVVHKWQYKSLAIKTILEIAIDRKSLTCLRSSSISGSEDVDEEITLTVMYCRGRDECEFKSGEIFTLSSGKDSMANQHFSIVNCLESHGCLSLVPSKTGGYVVNCTSTFGGDKVSTSKTFFADLDLQIRNVDERVEMEDVVLARLIFEESRLSCKWSPFYLSENVVWYTKLDDGQVGLLMDETPLRECSDGSFLSLLPHFHPMTRHISCNITSWYRNVTTWFTNELVWKSISNDSNVESDMEGELWHAYAAVSYTVLLAASIICLFGIKRSIRSDLEGTGLNPAGSGGISGGHGSNSQSTVPHGKNVEPI